MKTTSLANESANLFFEYLEGQLNRAFIHPMLEHDISLRILFSEKTSFEMALYVLYKQCVASFPELPAITLSNQYYLIRYLTSLCLKRLQEINDSMGITKHLETI